MVNEVNPAKNVIGIRKASDLVFLKAIRNATAINAVIMKIII
jgi:hypothetical protein